jgi:hypothetical protein
MAYLNRTSVYSRYCTIQVLYHKTYGNGKGEKKKDTVGGCATLLSGRSSCSSNVSIVNRGRSQAVRDRVIFLFLYLGLLWWLLLPFGICLDHLNSVAHSKHRPSAICLAVSSSDNRQHETMTSSRPSTRRRRRLIKALSTSFRAAACHSSMVLGVACNVKID